MRSSILRTVVAPLTLAATALVVGRAEANPPHASCQTNAPHHTVTLGANKDSVSVTSDHAYWDNACGCYIAQIEVPSTSTPAPGSGLLTKFGFGPTSIPLKTGTPEAECKWHERIYVYKKQPNGTFAQIPGAEFEQHGAWIFGVVPLSPPGAPKSHFCTAATTGNLNQSYDPPASGTDTYRVLRSFEGLNGKFTPVTVTAKHASPGPH
jgi:hypothetical protein